MTRMTERRMLFGSVESIDLWQSVMQTAVGRNHGLGGLQDDMDGGARCAFPLGKLVGLQCDQIGACAACQSPYNGRQLDDARWMSW